MKYEIVEIPTKTMAGISIRTTNENMQAVNDIGKLWEEFWNKNIFSFTENKKNNSIPKIFDNAINSAKQETTQAVSSSITNIVINIISFIAVFIITRIILIFLQAILLNLLVVI